MEPSIQERIRSLEKRSSQLRRGSKAISVGERAIEGFEEEWKQITQELEQVEEELKNLRLQVPLEQVEPPASEEAAPRKKAEVQEEISDLMQQIEAITVGGVPVEGYEAEYEDLQQRLITLQEQVAAEEPEDEPPDSLDEAPLFSSKLEEAKRLTEQEQFAEALKALDEAEKYAGEYADRLAMVAEDRRQLERAREAWKKDWAESIEDTLEDKTQPLPKEIETWIEEYWTKAPDEEGQVEDWLNRVSAQRRLDAAAQAAEALREKLELLWAECERAITANEIVAAADAAKKSLDQVRELQREYPAEYPEGHPVSELVAHAETWDGRARGPAATAAQTANFEHLLEKYGELKAGGHDRLPRFEAVREADRLRFTTDEEGREILELEPGWDRELVPADEAIREIEVLATNYACQKAEEKLERARHQAMPRDPHRASALLGEARGLFVPESHQQDTQWLAWLEKVDDYDRITMQPAVQRRCEAEERRNAALALPVLQAWDELNKVEEEDPYTPLLDQARASLHDRLIFHIKEALEKAQGLRRLRRWEEAQRVVEPFLTRTRQDRRLIEWTQRLEEFIQGCEQGARDEESILRTLNRIQELVDDGKVQEAHERLAMLEPLRDKPEDDEAVMAARERMVAYPQIGRLRDRIDARLHLQALLERASLVHDAATSDEELQALLNALKEAFKEHKVNPQIIALQKRLRARLLFRQAEREYGVLPFAKVRAKYQSVLDLGGDDAEQASGRLKQMAKDEEEAEGVERKLAAAQEHLKEKRYRQAYEQLEPLARGDPPVRQHRRAWELFGEAIEGLIGEIERKLEGLQRRGRRKLDPETTFEKVDELAELDPGRARGWDELVARCYIQLAQEALEATEALKHWQDARKHATPESKWYARIVTGLQQADKKVVFREVNALVGAWERAQRLLENLRARYPSDAEIRLYLADVYLRSGNLSAARVEFESAKRLLDQNDVGVTPELSGRLAEVQERLDREERLRHEQERVEKQLNPENPLSDFQWAKQRWARRKSNRLGKELDPAQERALENWWEALVDRVIEALEADWEGKQERGEPLWKGAWPMLKILELRKEHGRAQEVLQQVARESLDLYSKVDRALHETAGPLGVPAEEALNRQIDDANQLLEEAQTYQAIFRQRGGELPDLHPTDVDESVKRLRGWRNRLVSVKGLIEEVRGLMSAAMRTGEQRLWEQGEGSIKQIGGAFDRAAPGAEISPHILPTDTAMLAAHPTVRLLIRDFAEAKKTRKRLEDCLEELPKAWKREDFDKVRRLIEELQQKDRGGQKYGLSNRIIQIEAMGTLEVDLQQLEDLLTECTDQLNRLEGWAEAARQVVPWRALPPQRIEMLPGVAEEKRPEIVETLNALHRAVQSGDFWGAGSLYASLPVLASETRAEEEGPSTQPLIESIEETIKQAGFKEAFELCLEALCGSRPPSAVKGVLQEERPDLRQAVGRWNEVRDSQEAGLVSIRDYDGRWSLLKAKEWFEKPLLEAGDGERVLSRRAGLVVARGMAVAREIDTWVTEAQAQLEAIPETQQSFSALMQSARDSVTRVGALRGWWNGLWKRRERRQFREAAQAALDEVGRLCPESVDREELQGLLNALR